MTHTPILSLRDVSLSFGGAPLFEHIFLNISRGDKACLIGRNGSGKSTILKIMADLIDYDKGERFLHPGARVSYLPQDVWLEEKDTCREFVMHAGCDAFEADAMLEALGMDPERPMKGFSGGERRRVSLARALVGEPDILLLDEPTNHLDLPAIEWLEGYIKSHKGALVTISHDRTFLENVSNSSLWLDRGTLHRNSKGFAHFDQWSEEVTAEEERQMERMTTKLKQEMHWLHRGVTARRKRNQGRLRQLHQLREERRSMIRGQVGTLNLSGVGGDLGSKLVLEATDISKAYGDRVIIKPFSTRILRGDRIGIMGANGSGKTTLIQILSGLLEPDAGTVRRGTSVDMIYFDQLRDSLNPTDTLWQTLCDTGGDQVWVQGQYRHVMAYLKDFLFEERQVRSPVSVLSGGEKNRLALAKALTRPGNLLILDEPTNDLDMDTLDLLLETLSDYQGTLLIVSHDRDFLDKLTTSVLVMEGDGSVTDCVGGYQDYLRQKSFEQERTQPKTSKAPAAAKVASPAPATSTPSSSRRLSYNDKRLYEILPKRMDDLMGEIAAIELKLSKDSFYQKHPQEFTTLTQRLGKAKQELDEAELRWLELDEFMHTSTGE